MRSTTSMMPERMMSESISGGVVSSTSRTLSINVSIDCDIASRMIENAPDVTRLIDRLEKTGLAERNRNDEDRRETSSSPG